MTEACERLKMQVKDCNERGAELEKAAAQLRDENTQLHHKVAQAKASIVVGDADSNPDAVVRPDSSRMRMRLDDSSQISKSKHEMSVLSADHQGPKRGFSPERFN